jgi:hypothetical protein
MLSVIYPQIMQRIGYAGIADTFTQVGTPFVEPTVLFRVTNTTDQPLIFSIDGVNEHFAVVAGASATYDIATLHSSPGQSFLSANLTVFVEYSGTAPMSGNVYVESWYLQR